MLNREQVRSFYEQFGTKQDWQRFYEGPAIRDLLAHGAFERAHAVFELGCGTAWFAKDLLSRYLTESATYMCFDLSSTMVTLARSRLAKFGKRAEVRLTDGSLKLPLPDLQFDRFVSNYVLDLLPPEDIGIVLQEAHRVLAANGRLCLISLTYGPTPVLANSHLAMETVFYIPPEPARRLSTCEASRLHLREEVGGISPQFSGNIWHSFRSGRGSEVTDVTVL